MRKFNSSLTWESPLTNYILKHLLCRSIEAAGIPNVSSMVSQDFQSFISIQPQHVVPETEPPRQVLVEGIEQVEEDPCDDKVVVYHNEGVYN